MGMRHALVHDYYIKENQVRYVIEDDLGPLLEQVNRYLAEVNWEEWEKNEVVIKETAVHKSLVQTAQRMKKDVFLLIRFRNIPAYRWRKSKYYNLPIYLPTNKRALLQNKARLFLITPCLFSNKRRLSDSGETGTVRPGGLWHVENVSREYKDL
jgi:hypothetical protein